MTRRLDDTDEESVDTSYLDDIEEGSGCTEIWEHMSDKRDEREE